ncbi:hypothetical protein [Kribbella sp. VKM Ac-2566]|uniref:hypothetical protein n=1 Tax=Kribbella sp. VKM Ac-2566 TaxID=2512218 RepID=UPI00106315F4|nr:hypothetical protein [Kribbella sp. VKM Ac-2566]TDW98411.1 hypothetical protein EV647_3120 [Kribbella sp. VKM Ac-2566]
MAEDQLEAEDLLRILVREFKRYKDFGQNVWNRLTSRQRRRVGIETGVIRDRWGPDPRSNEDPRDRTARLEREAARAEEQVRDLESQNENLRGDVDRLQQQNRDRDQDLNNDRDRDGIDDRVENRTDLDRDHRDDATERRDEAAEELDNANDRDGDGVDDSVERREDERAREDDERRKREERESQQDRADGVDPVTAGAAAGAVAGASELADEQNAGDRQEDLEADRESTVDADNALDESTVDADNAVDDPSAEADNVRQTEPAAEQEGVDPYVAEEGALGNDERFQQNDLEQDGQQTAPTLDADNELNEPGADADNALDESTVDADNAVDEPSAEADNVRQTEPAAEQEGVDPYVAEEGALGNDERFQQNDLEQAGQQTAPTLDADNELNEPGADADNALDESTVDADNAVDDPSAEADNVRQTEPAAEETDVDQSAEQSSPGATNERVVEWDTERDGSHIELDSDQEWDGTVYQTGENGPSVTINGGQQGQEQSAPDVEGQEQGGSQSAEAVNLDRVEGQTFTVGQNGVQFADQNQASPATEGPSTSQAQGTQWRPPERAAEDPAIAEARETQGDKQQRGPGKDLPPHEQAQFHHTRGDQEPLSKVDPKNAALATNDRPGTPAAQRGQDRDRGGRGNDGRGGDGGRDFR